MAEKKRKEKIEEKNKNYIYATGRRKEAVARVRLYKSLKPDQMFGETEIKKGEIYVNEKPVTEYFSSDVERHLYTEPLRITNAYQNNYAITIKVEGGGHAGQLDAVIAGISNALQKLDRDKYRAILKKKGFLTRDARIRQRRNVGTGGKARRQKQSPKR